MIRKLSCFALSFALTLALSQRERVNAGNR